MIDAISSLAGSLGTTATSAVRNTPFGGTGAVAGTGVDVGLGFGQTLAQVAGDAVQTLKTAEAASITGIQGKASTQQVVEAVMSAQETLQTALSIRDKLVGAFQEVSRMAI